jgi:hypothetical protein
MIHTRVKPNYLPGDDVTLNGIAGARRRIGAQVIRLAIRAAAGAYNACPTPQDATELGEV